MIYVAKRYGLFGGNKFINWASGQGLLSSLAHELYDITIMNFDKYIEPKLNSISQDQLMKRSYDLVLNCALCEHITEREILEEIESLVGNNGCLQFILW